MKRAAVLIAIAAMLVCVIPLVDSADAEGQTTIVGFIKGGDITSSSSIDIIVIYSDDDSTDVTVNNGKILGRTNTVSPTDPSGNNRFEITFTPETDPSCDHYYLYFSISGFEIVRPAYDVFDEKNVIVTNPVTMTYNKCYKLTGLDLAITGEVPTTPIGDADHCFMVKSTKGTITGKVVMNTKEPVYLNDVLVTLFDLSTKKDLASVKTNNDGYSFTYIPGTYGIRYELSGYETVENQITISESDVPTKIPDVVMKESQSYFGLDLSHALMVLGGTAAIILLLFTMFVRIRLRK